MVSFFESCPVEVFGEIVTLLNLDDILSLRLCCKTVAARSSSLYHVKAFFHCKHVDLLEQALREFAQGTEAGGLRCLVQDLTLSSYAPQRTLRGRRQSPMQKNINLLASAFSGLARNGPVGKLGSLSLEVAVPPELKARLQPADSRAPFEWQPVWQAALEAFHTTFQALAASQLQIETLNIFNGPGQQRCFLGCDELGKIDWNILGLPSSLQSMQSLSINISNRVFKLKRNGDGQDRNANDGRTRSRQHRQNGNLVAAQDENNFTGLASLLNLLKNLKNFEMHYFRLQGELEGLSSADRCHERLLENIIKLGSLPNLTRCRLRGVYAKESDLLAFIKRTGVQELALENVFLSSGTYKAIFDHVTSPVAPITKLHFDVLYEMSAPSPMVLFLGSGNSKLGYDSIGLGSETLEQSGKDVKQPISYHTPVLPPMGSPAISTWIASQRLNYGYT